MIVSTNEDKGREIKLAIAFCLPQGGGGRGTDLAQRGGWDAVPNTPIVSTGSRAQ